MAKPIMPKIERDVEKGKVTMPDKSWFEFDPGDEKSVNGLADSIEGYGCTSWAYGWITGAIEAALLAGGIAVVAWIKKKVKKKKEKEPKEEIEEE